MKVQVLMSTYNGEKYLKQQIESLFCQCEVEVTLVVRDDGSSDNTCQILKELSYMYDIVIYSESNIGAAASFFELIKKASLEYEYTAFCDQDDFWESKKLMQAINSMSKYRKIPCMYYSNAKLVDEKLNYIGNMFKQINESNFLDSLIHNNVVGCTLVINRELLEITQRFLPTEMLLFHDQWISLLCSCFDGKKVADNNSYIQYRQHGNNVVGGNEGIGKRIKKSSLLNGKNARKNICQMFYQVVGESISSMKRKELSTIAFYDQTLYSRIVFLKKIVFNSLYEKKILTVIMVLFGFF